MKKAGKGFSLVEVLVVVAIAIIVTAISLPAVRRTISSYRLDTSGHAVASMLQQVRSEAVKGNTPYYALYNTPAAPSVVIAIPAARYTPSFQNYTSSTDPTAAIAAHIVFQTTNLPTHNQLETAMGLAGGVAPQIGQEIGFNARGLPCAKNGGAWICGGPVAFEWFMQNELTQQWAAITVSPAGRIKFWRMTGNGVWQ